MLEDCGVEAGDVDEGEDGEGTEGDGVEEEGIRVHVARPLCEITVDVRCQRRGGGRIRRDVLLRFGLHAEERTTHVEQLDGEEEREPGEESEGGRSSAEYGETAFSDRVVGVDSKVAVGEPKDDEGEGCETQCGGDDTIWSTSQCKERKQEGELDQQTKMSMITSRVNAPVLSWRDAEVSVSSHGTLFGLNHVVGRLAHDIGSCLLHPKSHRRETSRNLRTGASQSHVLGLKHYNRLAMMIQRISTGARGKTLSPLTSLKANPIKSTSA